MGLEKKYVAYNDASEQRKKRIEERDQRKQERYAASKERLEAKRERYADKLEGKGIASREEAMSRFDSLRGITGRSNTNLSEIMGKFYGNENQNEEDFDAPDTSLGTAGFRM
jgi:ABC-type phosphate transport system auxiliary subunit